MTAGEIIGIVGGLVGIVVFLGAAGVYLRGSWDKGTITSLKENNGVLDSRVMLLEKEDLKNKSRIDVLEAEKQMLLNVVTQETAIQNLTEMVEDQRSILTEQRKLATDQRAEIKRLADLLAAQEQNDAKLTDMITEQQSILAEQREFATEQRIEIKRLADLIAVKDRRDDKLSTMVAEQQAILTEQSEFAAEQRAEIKRLADLLTIEKAK